MEINTPVKIDLPGKPVNGLTGRINIVGSTDPLGRTDAYSVLLDTPLLLPKARVPFYIVGPFAKSSLKVIGPVTDVVQWHGEVPLPVPCEQLEGDAHPIIVLIGGWRVVKNEDVRELEVEPV